MEKVKEFLGYGIAGMIIGAIWFVSTIYDVFKIHFAGVMIFTGIILPFAYLIIGNFFIKDVYEKLWTYSVGIIPGFILSGIIVGVFEIVKLIFFQN